MEAFWKYQEDIVLNETEGNNKKNSIILFTFLSILFGTKIKA